MRSHSGFTLIEVLIVMALLTILSAIAYPKLHMLQVDTEGRAMAATVRHVREQIQLHASIADVPLSYDGYPSHIDPAWFPGHILPRDPWTYKQLKIQIVEGPKDATEPNNKTFRINGNGGIAGHSAWYNRSNGAFCIKVPDAGSEDDIQEMFHLVNRYSGGRGRHGHRV